MTAPIVVLGIESSCDESAVSVLVREGSEIRVVASEISSQVALHADYGGVVPELASREHLRNIPLLVEQALSVAECTIDDITRIGVTHGPGLKGCLLMGALFAEGLAVRYNIPCYGVNHVEGHLLSGFLSKPDLEFPFIGLIASGGHTEVVIVRGYGMYERVACTIDDAAGEAFDKSAALLGFPYPGGPHLAQAADAIGTSRYHFGIPMKNARDFSFSGLKTSISLKIKEVRDSLEPAEWETHRDELAWAIQNTIVSTLTKKVERVVAGTGITQVVVCGGVAANRSLRERLQEHDAFSTVLVEPRFCTDNAAMIAYVAAHCELFDEPLPSSEPLCIRPRWPVAHEVSEILS